jgi:RHS repeat-associated protein
MTEYGGSEATSTQKFTGKERDAETGLDYFGARYFSGAQGRFTSPDEPFADQHPADPQSWNLFGYVRNNPLTFVDSTGNDCIYTSTFDPEVGTVLVETGVCSQKGGTYVAGTIDPKSFTYDPNSHSLEYSYNAYKDNGYTVGSAGLPDPGIQALQRGVLLAEPGVRLAAAGTAGVMSGAFVGVAYGAITGGTTLTSLAIASTPLLPAVPSAITKLQRLGVSLQQAAQIVASPDSQKLIDTANGNNINVIQQVGDKLVRITLDPTGRRIISAGYIQGRNVANSIASGRFIAK